MSVERYESTVLTTTEEVLMSYLRWGLQLSIKQTEITTFHLNTRMPGPNTLNDEVDRISGINNS
ncbi:hypothetical protein J6590_057864 [Homalodisca vitripennis]|nr:hypothetical protein J6590_057864 [Homalodisca vitripennis]